MNGIVHDELAAAVVTKFSASQHCLINKRIQYARELCLGEKASLTLNAHALCRSIAKNTKKDEKHSREGFASVDFEQFARVEVKIYRWRANETTVGNLKRLRSFVVTLARFTVCAATSERVASGCCWFI